MCILGLSARERNQLKRKSRALQRSGSSAKSSSKRSKPGSEAADAASEQAEAEEDGQEWQAVAAGQWPFQALCDQMCIDVLDPVWEVSTCLVYRSRDSTTVLLQLQLNTIVSNSIGQFIVKVINTPQYDSVPHEIAMQDIL